MCKTEKRAMLRPESNNFAGTEWDKKDLFHFCTGHHLETMKYKVRNEILPIKKIELWKCDELHICIQNYR